MVNYTQRLLLMNCIAKQKPNAQTSSASMLDDAQNLSLKSLVSLQSDAAAFWACLVHKNLLLSQIRNKDFWTAIIGDTLLYKRSGLFLATRS